MIQYYKFNTALYQGEKKGKMSKIPPWTLLGMSIFPLNYEKYLLYPLKRWQVYQIIPGIVFLKNLDEIADLSR